MFSSVAMLPPRTFNNPSLNLKEINTLLQFLRDVESQLATPSIPEDPTYINLYFDFAVPAYSIFTLVHGTETFYPPYPNPKAALPIGTVYCTNGGQPLGIGATYPCHILGMHRPHLIRYNYTGTPPATHPAIGDRLSPKTGQSLLEKDSSGNFVAVAVPDTTNTLVWVVFNPADTQPPAPDILRLGYATITANLCGEASVTVTGAKYWDGLAIPGITSVQNPFSHRGQNGDIVLIGYIDFGAGADWRIFEVKKYVQFPLINVFKDSGCTIKGTTRAIATEYCADADSTPTLITLYTHNIPYTYQVSARTAVNSVRDQGADGACEIQAKTKQFCLFEQTPSNGQDTTVASFTPKTFLKKIFTDTMCVGGLLKPIIDGEIQTIYVLCSDTPVDEPQITGTRCTTDPSC